MEGRGDGGRGVTVALYPELVLPCGPSSVQDGLCGTLGWMELGDRDLRAGTVAGLGP